MFHFSIMSQEDYLLSDLEPLLFKNNITEDNILQLPQLFPQDQRSSSSKTPLNHELENLSITPTDKLTIALNNRPRKRKSTISSSQLFQKQTRSEEATFRYNFTKNPQFKSNLIYKIKENIN